MNSAQVKNAKPLSSDCQILSSREASRTGSSISGCRGAGCRGLRAPARRSPGRFSRGFRSGHARRPRAPQAGTRKPSADRSRVLPAPRSVVRRVHRYSCPRSKQVACHECRHETCSGLGSRPIEKEPAVHHGDPENRDPEREPDPDDDPPPVPPDRRPVPPVEEPPGRPGRDRPGRPPIEDPRPDRPRRL